MKLFLNFLLRNIFKFSNRMNVTQLSYCISQVELIPSSFPLDFLLCFLQVDWDESCTGGRVEQFSLDETDTK